jgi:GGDEF domain-containing protein
LAKLSIIKFKDFGFRCFSTLKDLMKSGRDMKEQIENVIRIEVINKMKQFDPTVIPVSLLVGLYEMIEETDASSMLTGMYDLCFPIWLRLYCEKLDFFKQMNDQMGNHDHYDAIIKLLAISVKDNPENVDLLIQKNLAVYITKIIKQTSWDHDRYIPCLKLVERLSREKPEAADLFVENHFHTVLLEKKIGRQLLQYKKGKSLYDDKNKGKESLERQMMKF